ncbi:MAG: OmpA family protein [Treponemataceae bacterium]|nr:OmpA family protein [Treponemataceae bacterium]
MKKLLRVILCLLPCFSVFAYNPSAGGELFYLLGTPALLADGISAAGGALSDVTAANGAVNPSLNADEERFSLDAGYTALIGGSGTGPRFGSAFHLGAVYPSKYGVISGAFQGLFSFSDGLDLGGSVTARVGFSREIGKTLLLGTDIAFSAGSAFSVSAGLGAVYKIGFISFLPIMKDIRLGFALTELGLPFRYDSKSALDSSSGQVSFPGMITPRFAFSGTFLDTASIKGGMSLDFAFPSFQNVVFSTGAQLLIKDMVRLRASWDFNLRETISGRASYLPTISLSVKIPVNTGDNSFFSEQGWQQSDVIPSAGARWLPGNVTAVSAGVTARLGIYDDEAPVIVLFNGSTERPLYFSPNNDGVMDELEIPLSITDRRYVNEWTLVVEDEAGSVIRTIENKERRTGSISFGMLWKELVSEKKGVEVPSSVVWNGVMDSGETAPDGIYYYYFTAADDNGNSAVSERNSICLDNTAPFVEITVPDEDNMIFGAGKKPSLEIQQTGSVEKLWSAAIYDSAGKAVRTWTWKDSAPGDVVWEGRNNLDIPVPSGVYTYSISSVDDAGNASGLNQVKNILFDAVPRSINMTIKGNPFSPNGDGFRDTLEITPVMVNSSGLIWWTITAEDSSGIVVRTWKGDSIPPGPFQFDGKNDEGFVLADGIYKLKYSAFFSNGQQSVIYKNCTIKNNAVAVSVIRDNAVFSPDGDGVLETVTITQTVGGADNLTWTGQIIDSSENVVKEYTWEGKPSRTVVWDGTATDGTIKDGVYRYRLYSVDSAGNEASAETQQFLLDSGTTELFLSLDNRAFSPNGDGIKDSVTFIPYIKTSGRITEYTLTVYDQAGRTVRVFSDKREMPESIQWNGISDSGIMCPDGEYRASLFAKAQNGHENFVETQPFFLDKSFPEISVDLPYTLFSPDGDGRRDTFPVNVISASEEELWTASLSDESGNVIRVVDWNGRPESFEWDGKDESDNIVDDGLYKLTIFSEDDAGNRCEMEIPGIQVDTSPVKVFLTMESSAFSPDGDGLKDSQVFHVTLNPPEGVEAWRFCIKNESGDIVKSWSTEDSLSVPSEIRWNGTDEEGYVNEGYFYGEIEVSFIKGNVATERTGDFFCSITPPLLLVKTAPKLFSPDNDGVNDDLYILLSATASVPLKEWSFEIKDPENGSTFWKTSGKKSITERMIWDGRSNSGELVQSAVDYPFSFRVTDELDMTSEVSGLISVDVLVILDGDVLKMQIPSIIFRGDGADFSGTDVDNEKGLSEEQIENNMRVLGRVAEILDKFKDYNVTIEGHANNITGTEEEETTDSEEYGPALIPLSKDRAEYVKKILVELGIDESRLTTVGAGGMKPLVSREDTSNWWKNRRVEFILNK